jgi:hypothetical protein
MDTRVVLPAYLFGTLGEEAFDVRSFCHGQPTAFAITTPARDVALAVLTLGIYTPHELELQCRPASAPAPGIAP